MGVKPLGVLLIQIECVTGGRCVLKMDHHCPWINNCVGHYNHAHFTAFLFWAVCGCLQASVVLSCSLYRALNRVGTPHGGKSVMKFMQDFFLGDQSCDNGVGIQYFGLSLCLHHQGF
jgi:hypothetical protein